MSYLARLKEKILANEPECEATKGTKAPYVPFVAPEAAPFRQNLAANEVFAFNAPGDPAIIAEGCGMGQAQAFQEARWHADKERCWQVFLRNAASILGVPERRRAWLVSRYQTEAGKLYGQATGRTMANEMLAWITAKAVH